MELSDTQHQMMGYDRSATMFAPDGHILQVEYAERTVRLGSTTIGMVCLDGAVIIACKGKKDELVVAESYDKIYEVDDHIMAGAAGIMSDARVLIDHLRVTAQQHKVTYDTPIDVESIIREASNIKQQYTQHPGVRPFGVSIMVAGKNNNKSRLYTSDITGNYLEYYATAIGENDEKIKEILRKKYKTDIKIEEGIKLAFLIFKEVIKDKYETQDFSVVYIKNSEDKLKRLKEIDIKKYR
jgi:proteasome alpha subunit